MSEARLIDYEAAARLLACTPRFVRKLVETRQLASVKVGRLVRIEPRAIEDYIERRRRGAMEEGSKGLMSSTLRSTLLRPGEESIKEVAPVRKHYRSADDPLCRDPE